MKNSQKIILKPCMSNILQIEDFIMNSPLLKDSTQRKAALIVSTEIFDNIIEHATLVLDSDIVMIISQLDYLQIEFKYETTNFDKLLLAAEYPKTYVDEKSNRYRGLGLLMVGNLSRDIQYIDGMHSSSICIRL